MQVQAEKMDYQNNTIDQFNVMERKKRLEKRQSVNHRQIFKAMSWCGDAAKDYHIDTKTVFKSSSGCE